MHARRVHHRSSRRLPPSSNRRRAWSSCRPLRLLGHTPEARPPLGNFQQLIRAAPNATYLNTPLGLAGENIAAGNRAFTRDSDGTAVSVRYTSATHYYVKDAIDSVVGLFSRTGTYLGGYTYSPYGEQRATGTNTALAQNSLRYISGYHDSASGLYKLGARYYDPSLGRFTQMDPSGQETNTYLYGSADPISRSDPSGLMSFSQFVSVLDALLFGADVYVIFAGGTRAGLTALFSAACGIAAGAIGAGGPAAILVGIGGCLIATAMFDQALADEGVA